MIRKTSALASLACIFAVAAPSPATFAANAGNAAVAQQSGNVSGRVQNVVTGQYLSRARVSVKGTDQVTFTDETGMYRLVGVRGGPVVLQVFYTDLDVQEVAITVPAGGSVSQDVGLTSISRYGDNAGVVKLDAFLVGSNKETDAEALATNEQRFAANVKNVIATDAMGDLVGASAGEFLKFLPGIVAEYDNAEVMGVSIRGIGSGMSGFEVDGAPAASANHFGATRSTNVTSQSIDNLSRIEVTKVPTPSMPADSLAGSINMISKSAFERSRAELRYGVNLTGNFNRLTLGRTPHPFDDNETRKIRPGYDFSYTLPIRKNLGIILTAMSSETFDSQSGPQTTWNSAGTATGASFSNPYFQSFVLTNAPRHRNRRFYSAKVDWKVTPNSVLSLGGRVTRTTSAQTGSNTLTFNAGTNGNPTVAGGVPLSYGPDFTIGATGRGALTLGGSRQLGEVNGDMVDLSYRFDDGRWTIAANLNYGEAVALLNPGPAGPFGITAVQIPTVRVEFTDIQHSVPSHPGSTRVFDNNNQGVDFYDLNTYRMTTATRNIRDNKTISRFAKIDLGRRLEIFPFPSNLKVGALQRDQARDRRDETMNWTFTGTNPSAAAYAGQVYTHQPAMLGFRPVPSIPSVRAWKATAADPSLLTMTPAQVVSWYNTRMNNSELAKETVTSFYVQGEARLFRNKLNILTGVRFERTANEGEGTLLDPNAVYVRNTDGTFARDELNRRIRKPEAGAAGSIEEARLIRLERAYSAERSYDGYYPSVHLTYSVKENFLVRLAYASTYGRPEFVDIIPNANINEFDLDEEAIADPTIIKGSITVRNTGLKPWSAHNYDLSTEYYTEQGGLFSAGVFLKEISDFFGSEVRVATLEDLAAVGLDPQYVGWNLNTKFNSGSARISGMEFNARHTLRALGGWGRYFTVFANATRLRLEGNPHASFESFVPKTANWGFSFNWKRLTITPKWNYRGLNRLLAQPAWGPDGFEYIKSRLMMDMNMAYRLREQITLTLSLSNVLNDNLTRVRYSSQTPDYARLYHSRNQGTVFSLGVKGTF